MKTIKDKSMHMLARVSLCVYLTVAEQLITKQQPQCNVYTSLLSGVSDGRRHI